MNNKIRPWYLILLGIITLITSSLFLLMADDMRNDFQQKHILHVAGLTMGILLIGWIISIRHIRDGGIITLFGSLILLAEALFAGIGVPVLFVISNLLSAHAGLGLIILARNQNKTS